MAKIQIQIANMSQTDVEAKVTLDRPSARHLSIALFIAFGGLIATKQLHTANFNCFNPIDGI